MTALAVLPLSIPSPAQGVWYLGPFPLRGYALSIILGIVVAGWMLQRRYRAKGGPEDRVLDLIMWMVPFGILGGRVYHVISSPDAYFGPGGDPVQVFRIWEGGLGIWGAIALGAVGAWIGARRYGLRMPPLADALAPALLVAQAIGRLGNWFNQELYGGPTTLPWGLQIDAAHIVGGYPPGTLFHPTFLYEMIWNLAAAGFLVWAERRFRLAHGRVFWLYVMSYTLGRVWIEALRIDDAEMVLGLRLNVWTSIAVFLGAAIAFFWLRRRQGKEDPIYLPGREPQENGDMPGESGVEVKEAQREGDPGTTGT